MTVIQRAALTSALTIAMEALCLFGAAGRIDIPEFWVYLAFTVALFIGTIPTVNPDLLAERMRPAGRAPPRRMWGVMAVLIAHFLVAGYDRGRLHFAGGVPTPIQLLGFLLVAAMWGVTLWAMQVNPFFSSVARLQPGPRPTRGRHGALPGCPPSGLRRGTAGLSGERAGARLLAGGGGRTARHPAAAVALHRGGPYVARRPARLHRLRRPGALAAYALDMVAGGPIFRTTGG